MTRAALAQKTVIAASLPSWALAGPSAKRLPETPSLTRMAWAAKKRMDSPMSENKQHCVKEERCEFAEEAADVAVRKVFAILGVDIDKPESVEAFREDLRFGKRLRKATDHGILAVAAVVAGAICVAAWSGVIASIRGH